MNTHTHTQRERERERERDREILLSLWYSTKIIWCHSSVTRNDISISDVTSFSNDRRHLVTILRCTPTIIQCYIFIILTTYRCRCGWVHNSVSPVLKWNQIRCSMSPEKNLPPLAGKMINVKLFIDRWQWYHVDLIPWYGCLQSFAELRVLSLCIAIASDIKGIVISWN